MAPRKPTLPRAGTKRKAFPSPSRSSEEPEASSSTGKRKCLSKNDSNTSDNESRDEEQSPSNKRLKSLSGAARTSNKIRGTSPASPKSATSTEAADADASLSPSRGKAKRGINNDLRPISDIREMFEDMVERVHPTSLKENPIKLNVATLCSGTDAPVFALNLIDEALQAMGFGSVLEVNHLFSCEIEPFKQGFIRRNLPEGTTIFRDVVELASSDDKATTAGGSKVQIPSSPLDILFAGCSCVDYSNMNQSKPDGRVPSLDRHLKRQSKNKGKGKASASEEAAPIQLDHDFLQDLDRALDELRQLSTAGESARTFFAAIKLISTMRPKAVILENVYGAPWDMYTDLIFPKIGYVARCVKLDSKDFYLPQTRQRGYLVAIDALPTGEESASKIAAHWVELLSKCKRPASSSITAFLRPADDPATVQARADMESRSSLPFSDWAFCSLRHNDARRKNGLRRDDNPFSMKAMRNGRLISASFPSHSWQRFWSIQVARVVDLMDIAFATAKKEGIDLGHKTAMIDVSQNVDRNQFTRPATGGSKSLGIIGCITPSGMPIVTDLMRAVTGTETLALQGLPVDELITSTETQAQLRDLAGNAMTVTVVGAAALALIVAAIQAEPGIFQQLQPSQSRRGLYLEAPEEETLVPGRIYSGHGSLNAAKMMAIAKKMVRLCHCPTQQQGIFACNICGATACSACRGNPEHDFDVAKTIDTACSAAQGKIDLRNQLPDTLLIHPPASVVRQALVRVKEQSYRAAVSEILASTSPYYFDEIKVTEVVTVCYKSVNSIARLVLSPEAGCCWYIYIAPWHSMRVELLKVFDFEQPIARKHVGEGFGSEEWSVWALSRINLTLDLAKDKTGMLVASKLAFADNHGAELNPSLVAWKQTVEQEVQGTYVHHPECGTAGNALRSKEISAAGDKVFMIWESTRLGAADLDHFVWTRMVRRTEPHEYRETFLHATPALSWDLSSGLGQASVFWPGYWSSFPDTAEAPEVPTPVPTPNQFQSLNVARIQWAPTQTIQWSSCHVNGESPVTNMPVFAALSAQLVHFPISSARLSKIDSTQTDGDFYVIPTSERDAFLARFAFLSSNVRGTAMPQDPTNFRHLLSKYIPVQPCQECSVAPPEITVHTREESQSQAKKDKKVKKVLIEDPDQAAKFERQFLDLPRAVAVASRLSSSTSPRPTLEMMVMLQPRTLASKALAYLQQAHLGSFRGSLALSSEVQTSFRVTLDYASPSVPKFTPFRNSIQACGKDLTGINLSLPWEEPAGDPPRFCRGKVQHVLRPSQKDSVKWMLQRESIPFDFVKSEIEEEVVRPLNLRVTGKAEWTNSFPYSSRGGVIAHEIGYGKTVVTLALIDHMREFDQNGSIAERKDKVDRAWSQELSGLFEQLVNSSGGDRKFQPDSFFIHLPATLVIVPRHITDQWAREVEKFLGLTSGRLIVIKKTQGFYGKDTPRMLKKAEVIIVSSAVFNSTFLDRLQTISGRGTDYPKGLSGRALEIWYQRSLRNHRVLVAYYLAGIAAKISHDELMRNIWDELLPNLIKEQQTGITTLLDKQVPEIDRRFYKVNTPAAASPNDEVRSGKDKGKRKASEKAESKIGADHWDISWLHSFSFSRIVWDECSYDDDKNNYIPLFVGNAVANAKWLLSGTPKLFELGDVCRIAAAFGIHIARPEPRMMPGLPAITRGLEFDQMSKSEQFHVFSSPVKSGTLAQERHSQGQAFVASYFRANTLEENQEIQFEEQVLPVPMTDSAAVRYYLLNQEVLDAGFDYTALPAHARSEVALKGIDLAATDGLTAAKMLLGLSACGLSKEQRSIAVLSHTLSARIDVLNDQMKQRWDKLMWLRRWILALKPKDAKFAFSDPVQNTLAQVDSLCNSLRKALWETDGSEDPDATDMSPGEALVVAGLTQGQLEKLRNASKTGPFQDEWYMHFEEGWEGHYNANKAVYTWLDFFDVDFSTVDTLTEQQLRLLAEDVCYLRHKCGADVPAFEDRLSTLDFLRNALIIGENDVKRRSIPLNIGQVAEEDLKALSRLEEDELRKFIHDCIGAKPKPQTRTKSKTAAKSSSASADKLPKATLVARLAELNLKFNPSATADTLQQLLLEHETGQTACEHYRDGRAAPSRHRKFEPATACGSSTSKQIDAATEELKHTMVHLAKTVEDLRATCLEANFIPAYSSLVDANGDGAKDKRCEGCNQRLNSFLVVACGHFLCGKCKYGAGFYCPVKNCPAFIRKRPVLRSSQVRASPHGNPRPKADCVADLIKHDIPKDDYVLVFAQYRSVIDALETAFKTAGLRCTNLAAMDDNMIATKLEAFKAGKAGQILLLDIDSETSAGSNLTIATHVVFANPYVHFDEEHQARTVRQARGRCIRTGQERKVHVYHFMVPGTIEEETLRQLGKDSESLGNFFEGYERIPWWLDEEGGEVEEEEVVEGPRLVVHGAVGGVVG